ncbi:PQQ-binding-like beta-propeller repeat protein [Streptomyces sp. NBC_01264]|uniref:outer membrane protein assembly factor BamB family protein n=1 Tax=Streptomyces sp. NBC_01264 TaxID=2903804 RepID=UPI0022595D33|nr:PQQ-binding-like beta-propeller repeat protein [Streptomyces sp. NBC_01264]MCX4776628.1 PQQ-like beta-propeller repeat protein [Streptomyces sp. NBC_01264]
MRAAGQDGATVWSRPSGLPQVAVTASMAGYQSSLSLHQGVLTCIPPGTSVLPDNPVDTAAFDPARGTRLWSGRRSGPVAGSAEAAGVLVLGGPRGASGTDLRTGRTAWIRQSPPGGATVRGSAGKLVLLTAPTAAGGITLQALTAGGGTVKWQQTFARQPGEPRVLLQDSALLIGYGTTLTAYRLPSS